MKRALPFLLLLLAATATAQTLNVNIGQVTFAYPAEGLGDVLVTASDITIGGKAYSIDDISSMGIDDVTVDDNTVSVVYNGATASVVIAGSLADVVSASVNGAHVTLLQGDTNDEITYTLGGSSDDGSLYMDGAYKATFVFDGLMLHNPDSAAVNIQDGKRIAFELVEGTTNTLSDGLSGDDDGTDAHKACVYVQGHTEISGAGTLTVTGNVKHGITSHEYLQVKKSAGAITVTAVNDGFHVDQYYEQKGGEVSITSSGDGIDVSETDDDSDENNGKIIISGGTLDITATGETSDAMKCDTDVLISGGTTKLLATGDGGRALNVNGSVNISGGYIEGVTLGGIYDEDGGDERKPHGMAVDEDLTIEGGEVYFASMSNKSFKVDGAFAIKGGTLMGIGNKAADDPTDDSQSYNTYKKVEVTGGSTVSYDGVSFTVPEDFAVSSANVIVSREGL